MIRDRGSALLEFLAVGIAIVLPLTYIALAVGGVQAGYYAATQAVREAGRAFTSSATVQEGMTRAQAAAVLAFEDHAIELPSDALELTCLGGPCLAPGTQVLVTIDWQAPMPWLPASVAGRAPDLIPIRVTHRIPVDEYRGVQE